MNKFLFKSADADLQKLLQLQVTIQKNVLYLTHQVDLIVRQLGELKHDKDLQTTVDKYFEDRDLNEFKPEVTSPQTDQAQD